MKKTTTILSALFGMIALFSSCEKEITTTALTIDETQTAQMKLYVKADLSTLVGLENAPDGTILNISIDNDDLNSNFSGAGKWTTSVTVNGGVVDFTVPANLDGVTVYIDAVAFERDFNVNANTIEHRVYEYSGSIGGVITGSNNVYVIELNPTLLWTTNL